MKKLTKKKGFTLVELLVVVAIIAVLMLLALPRFMDSTKGAKVRTFESNLRTIVSAASQYAALNNGNYTGIETDFTAGDAAAKPTLGTAPTDVGKLAVSLYDKPRGAKYVVSGTNVVGTLKGDEVGLTADKYYTITYTYETSAFTVGTDKVAGIKSSFE